jgi:tRNA nucleotidyltransferase (CCA-adding enzyme)
MFNEQQIQIFNAINSIAKQNAYRVFIVGGVIRDMFIFPEEIDRDIDFLIEGDARNFARLFVAVSGGTIKVFDDFYTAKIINPSNFIGIDEIDFASARKEIYEHPGALPKVFLANIESDLARRDFSINSMAVDINQMCLWLSKDKFNLNELRGSLVDPYQGIKDLDNKLIRVLHKNSFLDDPTRLFRACRYAARIDGSFSGETLDSAKEALQLNCLDTLSSSRIANELKKIMLESQVQLVLNKMHFLGLDSSFSLYGQEDFDLIIRDLNRLDKIEWKADKKLFSYKVFLRLVFSYHDSKAAQMKGIEVLERLGVGSKEIKKIAQETKAVEIKCDTRRYSDAGIVFQLIKNNSVNRDLFEKEAVKRGMIGEKC